MHAVIASRGSRQRSGGSRFMYTGSSNETCNWCKFFSVICFSAGGSAALCGIMFTVFGSTGFFRTNDLNDSLVIAGVVLLISSIFFIVLGFVFSRKVAQQTPRFSAQTENQELGQDE